MNMNKMKIWVTFMMISLCLFLLAGCWIQQSNSLPPTPTGWNPGTEGWIPPLPRGMDQPRGLSQAEWDKVLSLASTDEMVKQLESFNLKSTLRLWLKYTGGAGHSVVMDSDILSGKAHLPTEYTWYYPAISFDYRYQVARPGHENSTGRTVGVDIKMKRIIYTYNHWELPSKLPP
jgi:hypothetical protein